MVRFVMIVLCLNAVKLQIDAAPPADFLAKHCYDCHDATSKKGGLDLTSLKIELSDSENFSRWVKIHDRISNGEMPPKDQERPPEVARKEVEKWLKMSLIKAEQDKLKAEPRTGIRRLTRSEYENTIRDLFNMPGISLQGDLPPDGSAHGFDKNSEALDISHVNLAKYLEAAEHALDYAIATQPTAPVTRTQRVSLANPHGFVAHVLLHGDGVLLKRLALFIMERVLAYFATRMNHLAPTSMSLPRSIPQSIASKLRFGAFSGIRAKSSHHVEPKQQGYRSFNSREMDVGAGTPAPSWDILMLHR
jgi:hypothetical protein